MRNLNKKQSAFNGVFHLLEVKGVVRRDMGLSEVFVVEFKDGISSTFTHLHSFVVVRDGERTNLTADKLSKADLVWVDVHVFLADGTIGRKSVE